MKLDKKGHPYKVGSNGRRFFRSSPRPRSKYTPEEWRALSVPDRTVAEKKEALEKEIGRQKKEDKEKKKKDDGAGSSKDKKKGKKKSKGKEDEDDDPKDIRRVSISSKGITSTMMMTWGERAHQDTHNVN